MTVRERINQEFGVDLPIRGGVGRSIEDAIIIEYQGPINDYIGMEYEVLKYIFSKPNSKWQILGQELIFEEGKSIDKLTIEMQPLSGGKFLIPFHSCYFDITECFGETKLEEKITEEDKKLQEMQRFVDIMNEEIDKLPVNKDIQ